MSILLERIVFYVIGPIVGILVMNGEVSSVCAKDVSHAFSLEVGAVMFISSLALGTLHHAFSRQPNPQKPMPAPVVPAAQTQVEVNVPGTPSMPTVTQQTTQMMPK